MARLLTYGNRPKIRKRWPDNSRNAGRLQIGIVADITSERWPASNRNPWPASIGICKLREECPSTYPLPEIDLSNDRYGSIRCTGAPSPGAGYASERVKS